VPSTCRDNGKQKQTGAHPTVLILVVRLEMELKQNKTKKPVNRSLQTAISMMGKKTAHTFQGNQT
jgi:hypothetical protein